MSGMTRLRRVMLCSVVCLSSLLAWFGTGVVSAQGTAFTYQGRLTDGSGPANGLYDLQFTLYDTVVVGTGTPQGSPTTVTNPTVAVTSGVFTVQLDFGASGFPGADRFLEIGVRPANSSNPYTTLSPRERVTSTPYAIRSLNAATAINATTAVNATTATNSAQLGGVAANQYVVTGDARLSDARAPLAGSPNYIQNTTSLQASANFNISGHGAVAGTFGVGTATPQAPLHVLGLGFFENTGTFGVPAGGVVIGSYFSQGHILTRDSIGSGYDLVLNEFGGNVAVGFSIAAPARLLTVFGRARIGSIPPEASVASVCFNPAGDLLQCGVSSVRLRDNVQPFREGLETIRQLRPISFDWKDGSGQDIGLAAEEVAQIVPSLTFTDKQAEVTGVKYERLNILLINAVKEQQTQIEKQQEQLQTQQRQIDTLQQLICAEHAQAAICSGSN